MQLPAALRKLFRKNAPVAYSPNQSGFLAYIREPWGGAWQAHVTPESRDNLLTFSAVYASVALISGDVAKLRAKLTKFNKDKGIWEEVDQSPFLPVLRKPNHYQTRIQFYELWLISKLLNGNTYILKERDARGVVNAMYLLEPSRVTPLVAKSGDIFYQLSADDLSGIPTEITVPSSEMIHDRGMCLYHPLVGVPPIHACAYSGTQGVKIQKNSSTFFANMSRPSGMLTAPGTIPPETAARIKSEWEQNYGGANIGRVAVAGSGLEFKTFDIPAQEAQLIEQLKFTVEDVARAFGVPLHMIGSGSGPTYASEQARTLAYYTQTLQKHIEAIEVLLDEGLGLPQDMGTEFDLESLMRMDSKTRAETNDLRIKSGELAPNEVRRSNNLPPVDGGNTPYLQQQMWSLDQLAKRSGPDDAGDAVVPDGPDEEPELDADSIRAMSATFLSRAVCRT